MNFITETPSANATKPASRIILGADQRGPLVSGLMRWGQYGPDQTAGKFYPIACVALEIVQRCNLDCTLCYLSHASEMAHDVPLDVLKARIDVIERHYGPGTFIQITGGDPTLRSIEDLEIICRHIKRKKMFSCLMTNGIKATGTMLRRLSAAGMNDIAFHVDTTQNRQGFKNEMALNGIRLSYIARARNAGLRVFFNTTIYGGNFKELPELARFFRDHADKITLTSFQRQADTGRGVEGERDQTITQKKVMAALQAGMSVQLDFDTFAVGHPSCTRYASILSAGDRAVPSISDPALLEDIMAALESKEIRVGSYLNLPATALWAALWHPVLAMRAISNGSGRLWALRHGIWSSRGKVHRMAVLVHNFMDAENLQQDRCETCVFMVATENGPLSMCVHNARRDQYVFEPARIQTPQGTQWWSAATGQITSEPKHQVVGEMPFKRLKGRMRAAAEATRTKRKN